MIVQRLRATALALCLLVPVVSHAGPYDSIVVFGDSLSDGGSDFALSSALHAVAPAFPVTPGAPADFQGRFGNGAVAVDYLAVALGLPLTPHYITPPFLGGTTLGNNYAQGGATSGLINASLPGTIQIGPTTTVATGFKGVLAEVNDYHASTAVADPNALYVVWSGANDFLHPGVVPTAPGCAASASPPICTAVTNVTNSIAMLLAMGAQHILVPNLPDLGKTPSAIEAGAAAVAQGTAASIAFNNGLAAALGGLSNTFPGDIMPFDVFALFNTILADATNLGFTDTTDQCLTGSSASATSVVSAACAAAGINSYIFWDDVHPTTHTQALLGQAFAQAVGVPEPSEMALLFIGLLALVTLVRRTKRHGIKRH